MTAPPAAGERVTWSEVERIETGLRRAETRLAEPELLGAEQRAAVASLVLSLADLLDDVEARARGGVEPDQTTPDVLGSADRGANASGSSLASVLVDQRHRLDNVSRLLPAPAPAPAAPPVARTVRRPARPGRVASFTSAALPFVGALLLGFLLFQFVLSDMVAARSQQILRDEYDDRLGREVAEILYAESAETVEGSLDAFVEATGDQDLADRARDLDAQEVPPPEVGEGMALLQVPALDLEQIVVEGTSADALKEGPGHFRNSSLPGQRGNVVIAGRRTTYGAPFARLDELENGDEVIVSVAQGRYVYEVTDVREVEPGDEDVLDQLGQNTLTLITANPPYRADGRLAVVAEYRAPEDAPEDGAPLLVASTAAELKDTELGLSRDVTGWTPALFWGELLVAAYVVTRILYRRWTRWTAWLVSTPVLVALAVLFFESVSRLLPSTY